MNDLNRYGLFKVKKKYHQIKSPKALNCLLFKSSVQKKKISIKPPVNFGPLDSSALVPRQTENHTRRARERLVYSSAETNLLSTAFLF